MPATRKGMNISRKRGGVKRENPCDAEIVNLAKATGSTTVVIRDDLSRYRQNMEIVQIPPRNFSSHITWIRESVVYTSYATSSTSYAEQNFQFNLSSLPNVSSIVAMFDQYCIYAVTVTITNAQSSPSEITMLSAIDFDSVANVGPSGIVNFGSYNMSLLTQSTSLVRMVKPCIAVAAYSGTFTSYTTNRSWLDSNSTGVLHYGVRTIALQTSSGSVPFTVSHDYVIGLRNTH
jgi:hypothetical protein